MSLFSQFISNNFEMKDSPGSSCCQWRGTREGFLSKSLPLFVLDDVFTAPFRKDNLVVQGKSISFLLFCYGCYAIIQAMETRNWLLLIYKVPVEPAKKRIALWRRLKGMGAVYLQSGVCLLPKTDDHTRRLKIIENEIREMSGESVLLETAALDRAQEDKVLARFKADRDEEYVEFLDKCKDFEAEIAKETAAQHFTYAELEENDVDLQKLASWLEKIRKLDFYGAALAEEAEQRLKSCEALLDSYAKQVFEAHDENR